ncbi:MAG: lactoylglutathione lyase [Clostridiaceae bacterium]|nr:lactoylglutathione lyase [Clostridiaceae bacterium]
MANFRIDHYNINVTDLEKSIEFYQKALGLKEIRRKEAEDGSFTIVFLSDNSNSQKIELTYLREKEGKYDLGDNESHIAFVTDDYEAAYKLHKEMGCICYENKKMGIYFIEDPDGYWLEIIPARR